MIKPGTYTATVLNHAITSTQKGDPQAAVSFSCADNEGSHQITWYGSFSEKARPFTIKSLLACGLKGNNPAGPLEIGKEVSIVVEHETDDAGKTRAKVRWVNALGGYKNVISNDEALAKLSMLEGAVMAQRQSLGLTDSDEIPF